MNKYYLTLVLKSGIAEEVRKELLEKIKEKVKSTKEDLWGDRDLAYPIKKQTKGYYVHWELEADPKVAKDIDKTLKVEEDILRYLIVRR